MGFQKRDLESMEEVCLAVSNDRKNEIGSPPFDKKITSGSTKMNSLHRTSPCKTEIDEIGAVSGSICSRYANLIIVEQMHHSTDK